MYTIEIKEILVKSMVLHNDNMKISPFARVTEATSEKCAKSFLFQSLSMNLQRGNALCVMGIVAYHR